MSDNGYDVNFIKSDALYIKVGSVDILYGKTYEMYRRLALYAEKCYNDCAIKFSEMKSTQNRKVILQSR